MANSVSSKRAAHELFVDCAAATMEPMFRPAIVPERDLSPSADTSQRLSPLPALSEH